jgi:hypothetical protein
MNRASWRAAQTPSTFLSWSRSQLLLPLLVAAALLVWSGLAYSAVRVGITNGGFEGDDHDLAPQGWLVLGGAGTARVVTEIKRSGGHSLKIEHRAGEGEIGIRQVIDLADNPVAVVMLRAFVFVDQRGPPLTLHLRATSAEGAVLKQVFSAINTEQHTWREASSFFFLPKGTTKLGVSIWATGPGAAWLDDIALLDLDSGSSTVEQRVKEYVDDALGKIRAIALKAKDVDWELTRRRALMSIDGARSTEEAWNALRFLLTSLDDGHSHLIPAARLKSLAQNTQQNAPNFHSTRLKDVAYVSVPQVFAIDRSPIELYAKRLRSAVAAEEHEHSPCGWVLDLRTNSGGNMWPMLAGLAPFLGDGIVGTFITARGVSNWTIRDGLPIQMDAIELNGSEPRDDLNLKTAPVAILISGVTASAGEAVAIAFRGRENTKFFGQPTAGLTTANTSVRLADGSLIQVAVALMGDRFGTHVQRIIPDVEVPKSTNKVLGIESDLGVRAARDWLKTQACASSP